MKNVRMFSAVVMTMLVALVLPAAVFAEGGIEVADAEVQAALEVLADAVNGYQATIATQETTIADQATALESANLRIAEVEAMLAEAQATITTYEDLVHAIRAWQEVMPAAPGDNDSG